MKYYISYMDQTAKQTIIGDFNVLTIGDPHFKISNPIESEEMMSKLIILAEKMQPDLIVCLGDILDRHETIHVTPLSSATQFLYQLEQIAPLYVIIGNHDRPNNSDFLSGQHPFNALKMWKNTVVVDKVIKATFKNYYEFIFVPYVYPGRFAEAIGTVSNWERTSIIQNNSVQTKSGEPEMVKFLRIFTPIMTGEDFPYPEQKDEPSDLNMVDKSSNKCHAIFAHQEFYGAKMGAIISEQGDKWPHEYPLIISGHIHDYGRPQNNIIYTGTPMQHAFGDQDTKSISQYVFTSENKVKTIHLSKHLLGEGDNSKIAVRIYNTKCADSSSSDVNISGENIGWNEYRHDLGLTKRVICYVNVNDVMDWKPPINKLVKMVIRGFPEEIKTVSKYGYLNELKEQGVKISFKTTVPKNIDITSTYSTDNDGTFINVPYLVRLQQVITEDSGQRECFEKLFGGHSDAVESTSLNSSNINIIS